MHDSVAVSPRNVKGSLKRRDEMALKVSNLMKRDGYAFQVPETFTPESIEAPKPNIWAPLTVNETKSAYTILKDKFNLTASENATLYDNYVVWITLINPNKTDALDFLEGNKTAPLRYARAVIFFGGEDFAKEDEPIGYWQTYQVGPLLAENQDIEVVKMDWAFTKSHFSYMQGYRDNLRWNLDFAFYEELFQTDMVKELSEDLIGVPAYGLENSTMEVWNCDPLIFDKETNSLFSWGTVFLDNKWSAGDILPTGLFIKTNVTGRDVSDFSVVQWVYNNVAYNTTEEFYEAWKSEEFVKLPQAPQEQEWTNPGRAEGAETRPLDEKTSPIVVEPEGRRWQFSEEDRYFTWMDWSFYISYSRDGGVLFFDVKFKGERILYELALQEAIAEYAGDDPFQANTAYLDTSYGWGNNAYGLIPGYDCPANAVYFNSTWNTDGKNHYQNNTYCAYEAVEDYPITRHTSRKYVSVAKAPSFNIRFVATIGNYDYNFNYKFFMDGTLKVSVRAAGFIQGAYYNPETGGDFGYKIQDVLSGSFHDHVINFKADFDIGGTENRVTNVALKAANRTFPWDPNTVYNTKIKERSIYDIETSLNLADTGVLLVESANQNNTWGNPKAYRIEGSLGHRIAEKAVKLAENANWADHDLHFTRQKDTEYTSSGVFNANSVFEPQVNFSDFLDEESIDGEDVVCWFNLALHHLPNTQDIPGTIFTTAESNFVMTPYNYFDSEQSRDTRQQFLFLTNEKSFDFFGTELQDTLYSINQLDVNSFNYEGIEFGKDTTNLPSN
ncbi:uncharacterized protein KQ657_000681 [Scheffersomyces spartinae]|uniref:Amine oxidase n=1 Tax=Scheffersomyces spartinae TaxID=45513 RepID=A0A9P7V966_9ASCO|nr:uncharacterized protein KQ657_000681 [Scheffersomyces spartinae]KAG7193608.1 hypothetical protein KQ657_000681 [Scheffersomyces spartinae]